MANIINPMSLIVKAEEKKIDGRTFYDNGIYHASDYNLDGFDPVIVDCPAPTLITKNITENNTYRAEDDNASGYSTVVVNVPPPITIEKNITVNGEYLASLDHADGYSRVVVNVQPNVGTKNITENGTYAAASETPPVDGFSQVTVNVPGEEVFYAIYSGTPYLRKTIIPNTVVDMVNDHYLRIALIGAEELEEFECYSNRSNLGFPFITKELSLISYCPKLKKILLPNIRWIGSGTFVGLQNRESNDGVMVIGHADPENPSKAAVAQIGSNAFYSQSSTQKGTGWTITVYVNAETITDIPASVKDGQPWGANNATIVYRNSATGEVITE